MTWNQLELPIKKASCIFDFPFDPFEIVGKGPRGRSFFRALTRRRSKIFRIVESDKMNKTSKRVELFILGCSRWSSLVRIRDLQIVCVTPQILSEDGLSLKVMILNGFYDARTGKGTLHRFDVLQRPVDSKDWCSVMMPST
ncbi:hypothetical protein HN958_04225 [Candidatus Falkowbacteria bacterium]|jgi:hypothetical protein|nr:hypothetical protein [Candidatus Falkowbacteria bacterium]MBT7007683.1 hypothetical protein [Candidatus Falkowbacteria bacterium]